MTKCLTGKIAIVTGAASGIGRATTVRFIQEGARVLASDVNAENLNSLCEEIKRPDDLKIVVADVSKRSDTQSIVKFALKYFDRLDILVNSAGITPRALPQEADFEERWDAVMDINAKGTMLMCHAAVEAMRNNGGGAIINLASVMSMVGYPTTLPFSDGFAPYPQSKGAVIQLTRDLGVRMAAEGIRVNAVCPGFVYSALTENVTQDPDIHDQLKRLHPIGRMGYADEIANVITFLASDEASFVAGAAWPVDGGYTAA